MFWADRAVKEIQECCAERKSTGPLIVRDEKTMSGYPHIGSLLGVAVHDMVARSLNADDVPARYLYELNDTDPMDGMPVYLDAGVYDEHMGKPLYTVPAPDDSAANLAEYFAQGFKKTITDAGYTPEFYTLSSVYQSGQMNEVVKIALEHADEIREINARISGSQKDEGWLPVNVICESCGKVGSTHATDFDGETVAYTCRPSAVAWAKGCGHEGRVSPFNGGATLPWKVEWAAKFKVMEVDVEGAGKDHLTKGGAREVADAIARNVFKYEPPYCVSYEFFLVGGKKMSSSKGNAVTAREIVDLLPPQILSMALLGREIGRQKNFDPEGDSVPLLFDQYDTFAEKYWSKEGDDDARAFELAHTEKNKELLRERFLPRFSQIAFLVQMPHLDINEEVAALKGAMLTDADKREIEERARYAHFWLEKYAPEQHRFTIQEEVPESAGEFSDIQKQALAQLLAYVETEEKLDGKVLHEKLHEIKEAVGIPPREFFTAIYQLFLGRDSGPQAGWFLSTLKRDLLLGHLKAVTE